MLTIKYDEDASFVLASDVIIDVITGDIVLLSIVSLVMVEFGPIDPPFSLDILLGFFFLSC